MTGDDSLNRQLEAAIRAARSGSRTEAYRLLRHIIDADPSNESAWLWLAAVTDLPREARVALHRVEQLNPGNPRLAEARRWLQARFSAPAITTQPPTEPAAETSVPAPDVTPIVTDEAAPGVTAAPEELVPPAEPATVPQADAAPAETGPEAAASTSEPASVASPEIAPTEALVGDLPEAAEAEVGPPAATPEMEGEPVLPSEATAVPAEAVHPAEDAEAAPPAAGEAGEPESQPPDTRPIPPVPVPSEPDADRAKDSDTAPRPPLAPDTPAVPAPGRRVSRRACRFWLTVLLALALATALAVLVFVLWLRTDASGFSLLATATPDAPQRAMVLQPGANLAIAEGRWADAVAALEAIHDLDPTSAIWQHSAANAYYQLGVERRRTGDLPVALTALNRALTLAPDVPFVRREQQHTAAVLEGRQHYDNRDWAAAVASFTPVYRADPAFADVADWLYRAHFNQGEDLRAAGSLGEAQQAYQAALVIKPDQLPARQRVEGMIWRLRPPTPTITPTPTNTPTPAATPTPDPATQLILVDISEQRMYVYENNRLRWDWVASTGEPGKDTAPGRYQVRNKIDVAYASTWNLDMPYWMGIYQSGPLENGIHALPINRGTGIKLWEGLLGQRVSYGCVILSDENARTLFEWAQVGTPVIIQW